MSRYDEFFADLVENDSVFADKSELDPLAESEEIIPRTEQERALATSLTGVTESYLPTTVSVYGPPGRGKTITTRRLWREFAERTAEFGVEYVNLKECRIVFSAANEIPFALAVRSAGLDGVFKALWERREFYRCSDYPCYGGIHRNLSNRINVGRAISL